MHERALVSRTVQELVAQIGPGAVDSVTLAVGPDTESAVVEQAFRTATIGTPLEDADLIWVGREHVLSCLDCGAAYEGDKLTPCPSCAGNGLIVIACPEVVVEGWSREELG